MNKTRLNKVINSSLWAAYGDALGFITELADEKVLRSRLGGDTKIESLRPWKRLIGGIHGATIELPFGAYSDDTQLRLATSRSISSDGTFDIELFAKVELPVFQSYSLGAGRGTKLAASNLANNNVTYFSNFYSDKGISYFASGGNGASMRIQPHVWSRTNNSDVNKLLFDVFLNTISTHGNMVAIVGSAFHALSLRYSIDIGAVPNRDICLKILKDITVLDEIIRLDSEIDSIWLPTWENNSSSDFRQELLSTLSSTRDLVERVFGFFERAERSSIKNIFVEFDAFNKNIRGSSILTSVLAVAIAHYTSSAEHAEVTLKEIVNCLGIDTDTIATKVGALIGSVVDEAPKDNVLDSDYILSEAKRMFSISENNCNTEFRYPDLLSWSPPKYQNSALVEFGGAYFVEGLGAVKPLEDQSHVGRNNSGIWQWVRTGFGQTLLVKRRKNLEKPAGASVDVGYVELNRKFENSKNVYHGGHSDSLGNGPQTQGSFDLNMEDRTPPRRAESSQKGSNLSIDELSDLAIRSGFDPGLIGEHVLMLAVGQNGVERSIAYTSIIAKAKISRNRRRH